jgi:hypothetical protein
VRRELDILEHARITLAGGAREAHGGLERVISLHVERVHQILR